MGDFSLFSQSFDEMDGEIIDSFILGQKAKTTVSRELSDEKQFDRFAETIKETRKFTNYRRQHLIISCANFS